MLNSVGLLFNAKIINYVNFLKTASHLLNLNKLIRNNKIKKMTESLKNHNIEAINSDSAVFYHILSYFKNNFQSTALPVKQLYNGSVYFPFL